MRTQDGAVEATAGRDRDVAAPRDGVMLAAAAGASLWVLTWLAIQLHPHFGWAASIITGSR